MSKLYFKQGPMHSGKTRDILRVAYNYEEAGLRIFLIKPLIDTKGKAEIKTESGDCRKVYHLCREEDNLFRILSEENTKKAIDVIIVDEAQFITPEQVDQLFFVTTELGIDVICYGLRTDFLGELFPGSARLLALAHKIEENITMCADGCGRKAMFNERYVNDEVVLTGEQVCIDDQTNVYYRSVCGVCSKVRQRKKELL